MTSVIPPLKKTTEPPVRQDRVRLTMFFYRKPGVSAGDFQRRWRVEHSEKFSRIAIVKTNILTYEQSHTNEDVLAKIKEMGNFGTIDYDGMAILEAASWEKLFNVFEDKEYQDIVVADEDEFIDRGRTLVIPSSIVGIFDDPT